MQPPSIDKWPHGFDDRYVFKRLAISDRPEDQQALHRLAQEIFDVVALDSEKNGRNIRNLFRSSYSRNQIQFEWRKRLQRLPATVRTHVPDIGLLTGALYKYVNCVQDDLIEDFERRQSQPAQPLLAHKTAQQETAHKTTQHTPQPESSAQAQPEQRKKFDYTRPYIVPNGDVQIIRADHPDMPLAIRVGDFLTDKGNPHNVCPDGDWINIANIKLEAFRESLIQEGYLADRDTIWLHHLALDQINPAVITNPQAGEVRLASVNFASTLLRTIREHWPQLRNPSPDPVSGDRRSPLLRPNMTIIIRSGVVKGGALPAQQPALARPTERLGSNRIVPNRRSEQVARYAAQRHSKTKRKRAEADAEAGGKTATDNEAERNAPAAQRRRLTVAPKTVTVPTARLAPAPRPGPSGGPAFAPAPTGKEPQERIQDDFSFVELLGPEVYKEEGLSQAEDGDDSELLLLNPENFNEAGLAGDDSAALQAFFEQNEWTGERMED